MGLEQARAAVDAAPVTEPTETTTPGEPGGGTAPGNGDLAPDSGKTAAQLDLTKAEKFLFDGKEMTPEDLRKNMLRQQDYTKKTQAHAEERRKFQQEQQEWTQRQEREQSFLDNYEIDIQNVLRDPSKESRFKEIYPEKYHALLDKAMSQAFGDPNSPKRNESLLEQRLRSIENNFQRQEMDRARQSFETETAKNAEILDSNISRLSVKYPNADEDSVLARAQILADGIKKGDKFVDNFSELMEKLYKENHEFHEKRYQTIYKEKQAIQKQANSRGKDIGRGGATPGTEPVKMKLKDVKHHILNTMGQN